MKGEWLLVGVLPQLQLIPKVNKTTNAWKFEVGITDQSVCKGLKITNEELLQLVLFRMGHVVIFCHFSNLKQLF